MLTSAKQLLEKIRALPLPEKVRIMNVCGGHERSISMAGLRSALPPNIELIPGPGCPVCICPEEDIYQAIQIAIHEEVVLLAFGDMLRVPVNVPKAAIRTWSRPKLQVRTSDPSHRLPRRLKLPLLILKKPWCFLSPVLKPPVRRSPRCSPKGYLIIYCC